MLMDTKKAWITMLVFLLVAVIAWVGLSIYFKTTDVSVNPNSQTYTTYLSPNFDLTGFKEVVIRTKDLPVSPNTFTSLIQKNN
jgi:uncharacterized membrane protein